MLKDFRPEFINAVNFLKKGDCKIVVDYNGKHELFSVNALLLCKDNDEDEVFDRTLFAEIKVSSMEKVFKKTFIKKYGAYYVWVPILKSPMSSIYKSVTTSGVPSYLHGSLRDNCLEFAPETFLMSITADKVNSNPEVLNHFDIDYVEVYYDVTSGYAQDLFESYLDKNIFVEIISNSGVVFCSEIENMDCLDSELNQDVFGEDRQEVSDQTQNLFELFEQERERITSSLSAMFFNISCTSGRAYQVGLGYKYREREKVTASSIFEKLSKLSNQSNNRYLLGNTKEKMSNKIKDIMGFVKFLRKVKDTNHKVFMEFLGYGKERGMYYQSDEAMTIISLNDINITV